MVQAPASDRDDGAWMRVAEATKLFQVSRKTLYERIARKTLAARQISVPGDREVWVISRQALEELYPLRHADTVGAVPSARVAASSPGTEWKVLLDAAQEHLESVEAEREKLAARVAGLEAQIEAAREQAQRERSLTEALRVGLEAARVRLDQEAAERERLERVLAACELVEVATLRYADKLEQRQGVMGSLANVSDEPPPDELADDFDRDTLELAQELWRRVRPKGRGESSH